MILVYIAGKYSAATRCEVAHNVQFAREAADAIARLGVFPVTPHFLEAGRAL